MIYLIHGVVSQWNNHRISHSLLLPEKQFAMHLEQRPSKYVSLLQALAGKGDALTVDDGTHAGLDAALLARRFGHAVTWFINGSHVNLASPYFPFQISCMLDAVLQDSCYFDGKYWDLQTVRARRVLRLHLKKQYMRMRRVEEIDDLIHALSRCLDTGPECMEQALRSVSIADIRRAADTGVVLHNHGWTHINPEMLTAREQVDDIDRNEEYLGNIRKAEARIYAPAFGGHIGVLTRNSDYILLADRSMSAHGGCGKIINRRELCMTDSPAFLTRMDCAASLSSAA